MVGDDDGVPAGGRSLIEPTRELGHQAPDLVSVGREQVESTTTAWPVTAADVVAVRDAVGQHPVEAQDDSFRGSGVPLFLHEVNDVVHRRGDIVGFLFLLFTS